MPEIGTLRDLLRTARRWALCREEDCEPGDLQPFRIVVRPAIVEIIGPQWLQRLDQHNLDEGESEADADQPGDDLDTDIGTDDPVGPVTHAPMTDGDASHVPA